MINENLVRGVFLAAVALAFGLGALRYPMGELGRAGPGLFPLLVSSLLLIVAILTIIQSRLIPAIPLSVNFKNIFLILLALVAFVMLSKFLNMMVGIIVMVFVASLAGTTYSWKRNLQVSAGLIVVAIAFEKLLGLNLRLWFI
jgi:hypothetical protein